MKTITFDLHTHVNEKNVSPKDYFAKAHEAGIDVIAITEHAHINPHLAFEKILPHKPDNIILIPGSELNCEYGHLLAYGKDEEFFELTELFEKNVKFERCLDIAKDTGIVLSVSHPWGFNNDSFGYTLGFEKLEELVFEKNVGVEIYNGMIGNISNFIFETGWVKKPVSFLDFLDKNRVARKTGLARVGGSLKRKIDSRLRDMVERCSRAIELSGNAKFVTAGSDAHVANRIGEGIIKIKTDAQKITNDNALKELKKKENVIWSGPLVVETEPGVFKRQDKPFTNREILEGARYAAGSFVGKIREKRKQKKLQKTLTSDDSI